MLPVEPVLLPLLGVVVPVDCAIETPTAVARSAAAPAVAAKVVKLFMCLTPGVCSGASVLNEVDRTGRRSGRWDAGLHIRQGVYLQRWPDSEAACGARCRHVAQRWRRCGTTIASGDSRCHKAFDDGKHQRCADDPER